MHSLTQACTIRNDDGALCVCVCVVVVVFRPEILVFSGQALVQWVRNRVGWIADGANRVLVEEVLQMVRVSRNVWVLMASTALVVVVLGLVPDGWLARPADWLINRWASWYPDRSHEKFLEVPLSDCPELKGIVEPVTVLMGLRYPNDGGIGLKLRDNRGATLEFCVVGSEGKRAEGENVARGGGELVLGNAIPHENKGRRIEKGGAQERAMAGLLQRWYRRLAASRIAERQANDVCMREIMKILEQRNE